MQSKATIVEQYLSELPDDRRAALQAVRDVILKNIDKDFEEGMQYGMIGYSVPHRVYPAGYHCNPKQPLPFAALASQKNYMSLYMMSLYAEGVEEDWFRQACAAAGKKLDLGKCCIRFKKLDDLPLDVVAEAFRRVPAASYIRSYESSRREHATKKASGKNASSKKTTSRAGKTLRISKSATSKKPGRKPI